MRVTTSKKEDELLVNGLRKGDGGALEKIYTTFFGPIQGFVRANSGNVDDAKDVFQEGVMVMYRMAQRPDFKLTGSFLSLLYPVCRNIWFKSLRRQKYALPLEGGEMEEVSEELGIEEVINAREIDNMFRRNLSNLGEQCRQLLNFFFEGVSMKEIVAKMGLSSVSFAKKKKFQCKEKLVQKVKADPLFEELKN
ncbi:MAG: sigma-70 family RNA polymerase sigma factor [Bacteroidota bacterium]